MPLDIDPIFYTETMVQILREQGSTLYAMQLAEKILEKDPQNESVRKILEELKEEAKTSFERFRQGGQAPAEESPERTSSPLLQDSQKKRLFKLQKILVNIQKYRKSHGTA